MMSDLLGPPLVDGCVVSGQFLFVEERFFIEIIYIGISTFCGCSGVSKQSSCVGKYYFTST